MGEYIITKKHTDNNFYLFAVCGEKIEHTQKIFSQVQAENPNDIFQIKFIPKAECWWRKGGLD